MNLDATLWNDLQSTNASNEKRFSPLGVIDAVVASSQEIDYIQPSELENLRTISSQRNLRIPVIKDQAVTVTQNPGFSVPANLEQTENYYFVPFDVFSGFRDYPAMYSNNQLDRKFAIEQKMKNIDYEMAKAIENILIAQLEARKTQVLGHTAQVSHAGSIAFNNSTDILEIDLNAQKETMFFSLEALMDANELGGDYHIVTNRAGLTKQKAELLKYGAGNDKNLQALGNFPFDRIHETGSLSGGSDIFNGYLLRSGSIGVVENFPYNFANGVELNGGKWSVTDVAMPYQKMRSNIFVNNSPTDATSLVSPVNGIVDSNLRMTNYEEMAIWTRFYVVYRYNSDLTTRANDIVKIKGLTTNV